MKWSVTLMGRRLKGRSDMERDKNGRYLKKPKVPLTCKQCGKVKMVIPNLIKYRKYCSTKCMSQARIAGRVEVVCVFCKKVFLALPLKKRKYCSKACTDGHKSVLFSGSNHPNWKGITHRCKTCNKEFRSSWAKDYCSKKCSAIAHTGSGNKSWKGTKIGYAGVHTWMHRIYEKPDKCDFCGITNIKNKRGRNRIQWANKTGNYLRDRNDWLKLCSKCHINYDKPWLKRKFTPSKIKLNDLKHYKKLGLTQVEAAKKFGITQSTISHFLRNKKLIWKQL